MGKPFWRSVEYFFTGNYDADDGNNKIVAIGFGGEIHAKGGDDTITVGSIGATVYTGSGNDTVQGGAAYLKIEDTSGNLSVKGAAGYAEINKREDGNVSFAGLAGGVKIDHSGNHGDVKYAGAAVSNNLIRKGLTGNVTFKGAGGYNRIWHETNQGNLYFAGAGAGNKLDRTWFNRYQGSRGDVTFDGVGAANSISSRVETGNISFKGAGVDNHIVRKGKEGNITFQGAGASNRIERIRQAEDIYSETRGDIRFEGIGGYNSIYSDVAHGNINFSGGGAYNKITRKGADNDFAGEGLENAKASEIVLTSANLGGSWIQESQAVMGVKSTTEANTYLFAFADQTYTKISKVRLYNDPVTGKLGYYATSWYKEGNHLTNLADQQILSENGFVNINRDGAYTLSKLKIEHQQPVTIHAVEENLTEYEWITYGDGTNIDASDVTLSDAKMGGPSISTIGTMIDVKAVKSNSKPNTYIYASLQGQYTKIVVVELANDPKSGELKYRAIPWYKTGDYRTNLANEDISAGNGYRHAGYSLSDLHYSVDSVRISSDQVTELDEYSEQALIKPSTDLGESSGDVRFNGVGGGNVIKSNVTHGNVYFNGVGIGNVILHSSKFGNTEFNGAGAANVIVKSGLEGDLTFRGVGLANVLVHQSKQGKMNVYAGGAVNVLVRIGDGQYLAHLLAYGNISVHKGNGASRVVMFGGYNTHTQIGNGNGTWAAAGGFNVMTQVGDGDITSVLVGGANVLTKIGDGDLTSGMIGGANIITHISGDEQSSDTTAVALGGLNVLTKKGKGNALAVMAGGGNVLTHIGDGSTTGVMVGGANILTKVGDGDTTGIMLGLGNVLTHIGNGQTLGVMGAVGNVFTKVGDGTAIAAMVGAANIFTHVGEGDSWALMGGAGNVFTKIGNGNALALMVAKANVFTHIGNGTTVALMLAEGNIATKIGNGMTMAAMVGNANIFTHIGDGDTFAAMIGQANIFTKVGNDLTAALMVGQANVYTHVGNGTSIGILAGEANIMTKVGDGTTLAAMFAKANIMTHVGDGLTGVLALGEANIVTKVGDGFMGVVAAAKANVVTHVGDGTTAAVLLGKGNILTKVGDGTTVGLLISDIGNIMTHVGDGMTIGIAKGKANIITKVGDGLGVNVAWGEANILTHVGDGQRYNFAKGKANIITKVGDGQEVSVVHGKANIITHVGDGDDYTGAWGDANIMTKVGDGRNVVLAKGEANIVTQVGDGDSFNALWSKGNIVTKVGDGMQVTAAKGKANIVTTIGNGLSVTATYGDLNINTKVGDGVSVNVAWGKYNVNTKVGDGLNVAVMKGKANANIQVGDGLGINASYAQNNVAIKIGNGDFYSLSVASSNTKSNKLSSLFDNIKQTVLGMAGSQGINFLVQGDDASTSASRKGRGAIATPEITKLNGFQMEEIAEIGSDLGDSMSGAVTDVETPDVAAMQSELAIDEDVQSTENKNLIVNGDFEQGGNGWNGTHGIEASHSANAYGVDDKGHGALVSELDTYTNTSLSQDLINLSDGEVISLSFDFTKRAGLSNNEGMDVIWNGNLVFSASGDETTWQQQTLKLTAKAGSNRIEFKGTGQNNGLGYILDNVVAISEIPQQTNAVSKHAEQNKAAQNATADKERAEADSQRLKQEKAQQLAALSGSQSQLEATDQNALKTNGEAEREALAAEQQEVTKELTDMTKGLDALDGQANYQGESGDNWIDNFAGGILDNVQSKLDDAKSHSNEQLEKAAQQNKQNQLDVQDAVAKSEAGVTKGEENEVNAQQDISDAKAKASSRKDESLAKQQEALQAATKANADSNQAQQRGEQDSAAAQSKSSQAQENANAAKQDKDDKPDRDGVSGSGLSGKAYEAQVAAENTSNVDAYSEVAADGRFSEGLTEQELEALEDAKEAVNRLQVNAGIRAKNTGSAVTEMFTNTGSSDITVETVVHSRDYLIRDTIDDAKVNLDSLSGAHDNQTSHQPSSKAVPEFNSHFDTTSIGIENELSGLVVVLPSNSAQKFGYVHDSEGNPLFMLTKDMNQGGYSNPAGISDIKGVSNWQTHTIELVTYPSETSDKKAVEDRKEAMLWLAKEFTSHINDSNHKSLSNIVSQDNRFTLVISNPNHLVAAGNGTALEAHGQTIGMTPSGQQATMAVNAKAFGMSSSPELKLLESASWYKVGLQDEFSEVANNVTLDDPTTAKNVFAYLTSIYLKTADLAKEYGLYINDWDPVTEGVTPNAQGLTDPKVKNAWEILPRTRPVKMLELLSKKDSMYVRQQISAKLKSTHSDSLAKNVFEYFQYGGEVAGHAINNATTGSAQSPEPAILFEFRTVPNELSGYVPKTESTAKLDVKALDQFDSVNRRIIIAQINELVSGNDDFDTWYQAYREDKGLPPVKNAQRSASANHKAEWVMIQNPELWTKITEPNTSDDTHSRVGTTTIPTEALESLGSGHYKEATLDTESVSQDKSKIDLMSVADLLEAAYVKGKIRGESYQKVIDALANYHATSEDNVDSKLDAMVNLRQQVEGYLLGHPDSGRVSVLNALLSQVSYNIGVDDSAGHQDAFSKLYAQLDNANVNDSKHLYIDANGDVVTKGKENITDAQKLASGKLAADKLKTRVAKEYGQAVADAVFNDLQENDLAKDSKGVDVAGLKKIHRAIEQQISPVSATLFIWKPSKHSSLGHAAMQIGQGRVQVDAQDAPDFNQENYVSWWPLGSKSSKISDIFDIATSEHPELKIRKSDLSQPAHQNDTLEYDMASEENDNFGMEDGDRRLERFIEKLNIAKGIDAKFKDISETFTMVALMNPDILETSGIPEHVYRRFVDEWNDTSNDMMDVAKRFAEELQKQAQASRDTALMEKRIGNVVRQFADRALEDIENFKTQEADLGRVFRINLEGLDVAAMQAEWKKLSNDADARYQLLTKNCSTTVAKVLKAGGADKLIGHTWTPNVGVWTPTALFNYGQALQEAQLEIAAKKQSRQSIDDLDALSGKDKVLESVVMENDGKLPREKASLSPLTRFLNNELYGSKEDRRKIGEITQTVLDHAVTGGKSDKVTLKGESGRLSGYYHHGNVLEDTGQAQDASQKVVLFVHGSGSSAEEQASAIRNHYQKQGIDMLAVNMRGYGESDGGPSEKGLYRDARTMFSYLVNDKGIDPSNIIIHGYSMGGPIAADLARYAALNNQTVSGLLLDRPMPSMTKAITAHEVVNPAGIVGSLSKWVNGQFSVEKNLKGLPKDTPIMLLTDNEGLGDEGEKLRAKLVVDGYQVSGENTFYGHEASNRLMSQYAGEIVSGLFDAKPQVGKELESLGNKSKVELSLNSDDGKVQKNDVESWDKVTVTPQGDGADTRFDGQLIIQMENDPAAAKAAANLAGKHPDSSVVVQLDTDGKYRVVYGDPSQLSGKLRWQIVGHGRDESDNNNTRLSDYSATELATKLTTFNQNLSETTNISSKPEHISIVGCSLVSTDKQKGFAQSFITAMAENGIRTDVSARSTEVAVDAAGRKHTRDVDDKWDKKLVDNKVVLSWDDQGKVAVREEAVRNSVAEGDIDLSRVGQSENDGVVRGAIADNDDVFTAQKKRENKLETSSSDKPDNKVSYSGNIQVNVGDGEFTALNWGTSNVAVKVGTGGFKSLAFGDNNVMVHIGNGDSKHSFDIGGYQALEGAQMFIGNRNVSFNMGRSNDLIVMMDKSIPTPPLVNPFDGAVRISGVLQEISESGKGQDWLAAQDSQWTLAGAKKFVNDMSGLDQTSSVDYKSLVNLDSQNERSSRGLKSDTEAALNKKYNEWLSGNKSPDTSKMSRTDKLKQKNDELAFNLAVGGRGADIQVTTGNWNFMFGDNIQSILDTNLGSLFGVMTQQFSASGKVQTTFTYNPQDLPRQLKNKLLGKLANVGADTTLADIFDVDYTADGQIVARNGEAVDAVAILTEMVEVVAEFGGEQLKSFTDPSKLLDSLKSSLDMGKDGLTSFAESHGLKEKAPAEQDDKLAVSVNSETGSQAKPTTIGEVKEKEERPFGFNALNLPNLFSTIFSSDKQLEMKSLVTNLKENLTADLLNMKEKTFDFLRNSGHLKGDGDVNVSLGNYNFNWGGDGKDLGAYLGDNNNFWGGRGDDVYYATGTSNIFTGGEGNDVGVLMGRENMMFGGKGNDTAVVAGRINHVFMGDGNDQVFVFGEGGTIESGSGLDYVVTSGNYNSVQAGDDQDYVVTIGNHNQIDLGHGDDFSNVFGNYNKIDGKAGKDVIKLMGYHAVVNAGADDDHLIAASISKFSKLDGGEGNDLLVLGGYSNTFQGGAGIDSFMVSANVIENQVTDISKDDFIVFDNVNWNDLWLQRSGSDLKILINSKTDYRSDQAKFESLGSVTFSDYFAGNRAELVISMDAKQKSGVRDYVALSNSAVDNLVQAMSGFAPSVGNAGFMDSLDNSAQHKVALAWGNVNKGTGYIA